MRRIHNTTCVFQLICWLEELPFWTGTCSLGSFLSKGSEASTDIIRLTWSMMCSYSSFDKIFGTFSCRTSYVNVEGRHPCRQHMNHLADTRIQEPVKSCCLGWLQIRHLWNSKFSMCLERTEGLQNRKGKCNHTSQAVFKEGMLVLIRFPWVAGQVLVGTCLWAFVGERGCSRGVRRMDLDRCQGAFAHVSC